MNVKQRADKLKTDISAVFIALKDRRTPFVAKILAAVTVAYALSPIDIIPDFIPFFGYLDDIVILPVLVYLTVKFIPREVFESCRYQASEMTNENISGKWYYAVPVILVWGVIIICILKFAL